MPYQGGVQLLPNTSQRPASSVSYTRGNRYFWMGIVLGAGVLIVGAILGGYASSRNDEIARLDGQMQTQENSRNKIHEKALIDAQQQSKTITQLLGNKVYWSAAFERIENLLQSSVSLSSLNANADKATITFTARAANYTAVSHQIASFVAATGIKDITVPSVTTNQDGSVEFSGELSLDAAMLSQDPMSPPSAP